MTEKELGLYRPYTLELLQLEGLIKDLEEQNSRLLKKYGLRGSAARSLKYYHHKQAAIKRELRRIENAIAAAPEAAQPILRARFIRGLSWEEVAIQECYSTSRIHQIKRQALRAMAE